MRRSKGVSKDIEYRYPIGGGYEALLRFDGRVFEFFNLGAGGSVRAPFPESRFEKSEANRKGVVEFKLLSSADHLILDFPVEAEYVTGFDDFIAQIEKAGPKP